MKINGIELKEFSETEIMMNEWKCPKCGLIKLEEQNVVGVGCCDEDAEMVERDLALIGRRYETPKGESVWIFL